MSQSPLRPESHSSRPVPRSPGVPPAGKAWETATVSLEALRGLIVCDGASIWVPGGGEGACRPVPVAGWGAAFEAPGDPILLGELCCALGTSGDLHGDIVADVQSAPEPQRELLARAHLGSVLLRPLIASRPSMGLLCVQSRHPGFFTGARIEALDRAFPAVAVHALGAILESVTWLRERALEIVESLTGATDFEEGCRRTVETIRNALGVTAAAVLYRDSDGRVVLKARSGGTEGALGENLVVSGDLVESVLPAMQRGVAALGRHEGIDRALFGPLDPGELLSIPLAHGTRQLGFLLLRVRMEGIRRPHLDPDTLSGLGLDIGLTLETLRLIDDQKHSLRTSRKLLQLSHEVSSVLDLGHVPQVVAQYARDVCEADECVLFLLAGDGETLYPVVYLGAFAEQVMKVRPKLGQGITGAVAANRRGEIANHAETDPRAGYIPGTPVEPEAILAVPMVVADNLLGVLTLYKLEGRTFRASDLDAVNIFSTQAAIALENARLFASVKEERGRLVTMLEHMKEGVVFGDKDGKVLLMNTAAGEMLSMPAASASGTPILDLLGGEDLAPVRERLLRIREGRARHFSGEHRIRERTTMVSISSVPGADASERLGEVLLLQDVTQHKLIEAQLLESSKMSAVGQLAAGVAHEFNNLIAGIYGYAQLIQMNPASDAARRGVDVILQSSERAQGLTNSLLTFSRRRPGRREPVDIDGMISDTLLLLARQFEKAGIRISRETGNLPKVVVDGGEIQQVFLNLFINALQALPEGGEITVIGCTSGGMLEVEIADDGEGIPAENLPRVFEPFFTTKGPLGGANVPGSGLGLTTAYNILKDHGGGIDVRSDRGRGAAFTIRLPLEAPKELPGAPDLPGAERGTPGSATASVLILGAGEEEGREIEEVLASLGHTLQRAPRLEAQLEKRSARDLALIVLCGPMRVAEGSDYSRIRETEPHLPVLFVAERNPSADFPGLSDRWAFLLRKPYRNRDLASMASRLITRRLPAAS